MAVFFTKLKYIDCIYPKKCFSCGWIWRLHKTYAQLKGKDIVPGVSTAQVRKTADSAVHWCLKKGGSVDKSDLVHRISSLGTSGIHERNCERDFHTMLKSFSRRLGVQIDTVKARIYNHADAEVQWQDIHVIFPDVMAEALFNHGELVWKLTMFGGQTQSDVADFWKHCGEHCDWFKGSPCHNYHSLSKLIPMSFYGDDIAAYKGSETGSVTILGWSSDFAYKNKSILRYWPIAVYPEYSSTEWTYDDILGPVVHRVQTMLDPSVINAWSGDGYMFVFSSLQGDLKFIKDQFKLHNYRANSFCSTCGVQKKDPNVSLTLADFRESAQHAATLPDLSEFAANRCWV